jgi:hypothetical protein
MTMANGAGLSCAESQTRSLASNQRICGTGRRHGNSALISESGTFAGKEAMSCGGVPNTVARSPAESARPMTAPETGGDCAGSGSAAWATAALKANANGISLRPERIVIGIVVTIAATGRGIDDRCA